MAVVGLVLLAIAFEVASSIEHKDAQVLNYVPARTHRWGVCCKSVHFEQIKDIMETVRTSLSVTSNSPIIKN